MTVIALAPKAALDAVALQKGLVSLPTIHPIERVARHVTTMAAAFREQDLPVVLVNVAGAPAVRTEQRRRNHAFPEGWTEVTARQAYERGAYELGFNTTLAIGAMTDTDADAHTYNVTRVFPKNGETGTTGEIITLLKPGT